MFLIDVNVLIAAHRVDHPHHGVVHPWLERALESTLPSVTAPDVVWSGLARICTNPRVFVEPSTINQVRAFSRAVRAAPAYCHLSSDSATIDRLFDLCEQSGASGDLVTDAYIATIALSMAATVVSLDRDFRRFDGLKILDPTAETG